MSNAIKILNKHAFTPRNRKKIESVLVSILVKSLFNLNLLDVAELPAVKFLNGYEMSQET